MLHDHLKFLIINMIKLLILSRIHHDVKYKVIKHLFTFEQNHHPDQYSNTKIMLRYYIKREKWAGDKVSLHSGMDGSFRGSVRK